MPLTQDTLAEFFDEIADAVRDSGALNTYEEAQQICFDDIRPRMERVISMHVGEEEGYDQDARHVTHIGDLTHPNTAREHFPDTERTRKEAKANEISSRRAIAVYMPYDKFSEYLDFFVRNIDNADLPFYRAALETSLLNFGSQVIAARKFHAKERAKKREQLSKEVKEALRDYRGEYAFLSVQKELLKKKRDLHVDDKLITSMVIFQAAGLAYIHQLVDAIERDYAKTKNDEEGHINEEQHRNALATMMGPFKMFIMFQLYTGLLSSILHEKDNLPDEDPSLQELHLTRRAIGAGWNTLFDAEMLSAYDLFDGRYEQQHRADEEGLPIMRCPANQFLRRAQRAESIEGIWDYVNTNQVSFTGLIEQVNEVIKEVDTGRNAKKYDNIGPINTAEHIGWLQGLQRPEQGPAPVGKAYMRNPVPRCPYQHAANKGGIDGEHSR